MIIKEIDIAGEKFQLTLTEQVISQVNNLKSLYNTAYEDPESFEQVSAEISSIIQEISNAVKPKPDDTHLDDLIQQVIFLKEYILVLLLKDLQHKTFLLLLQLR